MLWQLQTMLTKIRRHHLRTCNKNNKDQDITVNVDQEIKKINLTLSKGKIYLKYLLNLF